MVFIEKVVFVQRSFWDLTKCMGMSLKRGGLWIHADGVPYNARSNFE